MNEIHFCKLKDIYGQFSNFYPARIELDGRIWKTSEAYFQAMKFKDDFEYQEVIRNESSPMGAAMKGRSRKHKMREDWNVVKDEIMKEALLEKFGKNEVLRKVLLGTGEKVIVEVSKKDRYWGRVNDVGRNRLGELLMEVRGILTGV